MKMYLKFFILLTVIKFSCVNASNLKDDLSLETFPKKLQIFQEKVKKILLPKRNGPINHLEVALNKYFKNPTLAVKEEVRRELVKLPLDRNYVPYLEDSIDFTNKITENNKNINLFMELIATVEGNTISSIVTNIKKGYKQGKLEEFNLFKKWFLKENTLSIAVIKHLIGRSVQVNVSNTKHFSEEFHVDSPLSSKEKAYLQPAVSKKAQSFLNFSYTDEEIEKALVSLYAEVEKDSQNSYVSLQSPPALSDTMYSLYSLSSSETNYTEIEIEEELNLLMIEKEISSELALLPEGFGLRKRSFNGKNPLPKKFKS